MSVRKLLFLPIALLASLTLQAQELLVYHVVGNVVCQTADGTKPLVMNMKVGMQTVVNVPYGGKLEMLDEAGSRRITLTNPGKGTIASMINDKSNRASKLTGRYVAYVKRQMTNKGLTSRQRYTDFATVTRQIDSVEAAKPKTPSNSLADRFNSFKQSSRKTFVSFREEANKRYIEFVRNAWREVHGSDPVSAPAEPEVPPVVFSNPYADSQPQIPDEARKLKEGKVVDIPSAFTAPGLQPVPVEPIKQVDVPMEMQQFNLMPFSFFGKELQVRLDETLRLHLDSITPDNVADALTQVSSKNYDNLLYDCLQLREQNHFCDWAYLLMLKELSEQYCGPQTNEAALMLGYLYCQSGYKVRYATAGGRLYLLVASRHFIYDKQYYAIEGENFYPLEEVPALLSICDASFPKEQSLSLFISSPQEFSEGEVNRRHIKANLYDISFEVEVCQDLMDFYATYPASIVMDDFTTRWAMYANTPLNNKVKEQLYPQLKAQLDGLSEEEAVSRLLNLVQTGFVYALDDEVWNQDRVFFAEETLFYPKSDCEDRSILFTRLVRDLLHLPCVLIYYPGHLAAGVGFSAPVSGDYYECNGRNYIVCDPTYINASIGMQMPSFAKGGATLIPINF